MTKGHEYIWGTSEADNYYKRAKMVWAQEKGEDDVVSILMEKEGIIPKKVLDIGCCNGKLLAKIHEKYGSDVTGVEPSKVAISEGKEKWPFIKYICGTAAALPKDEKYDLVIINFVFHWIGRNKLFESIYNIDLCLEDGGFLIIGDFYPGSFIKTKYHHLPNENLYTYKQKYNEIFLSTGMYKEISKIIFNADKKNISEKTNNQNIAACCLLKKQELYAENK